MKIGWLGLGKMGKPMSARLLDAGYAVMLYNRTKDKVKPLEKEGLTTAENPKELLEKCGVVFVMISDDKAVEEVFKHENGFLNANTTGKIVVNMSTISPEISRRMSAELAGKGNEYLDAPVSGSVKQAEEASHVIIAGGKKEVFEKVKPLLELIGKKALLVGETGAGNTTKLAVNTYLGIVTQGLAEVINFSKKKNIETEDLMSILNNSALACPFIKIKGDAVLQNNFNAAFTLSHLTKDLRLAQEAGLDSPLGNAAFNSFSKVEPELGEEDVISIIKKI